MVHVLLVTFPAQGHINPSLQFAKRLSKLGVKVTFLTSLSAIRRMTTTSLTVDGLIDIVSFTDGYENGWSTDDAQNLISALENHGSKAVEDAIRAKREEGNPFTRVIYSLLVPWAGQVASHLQIPGPVTYDITKYGAKSGGDISQESAPGDSPNTDGIHLGRDTMINIKDSIIKTGDDCVSIGDESKEIHIQNVTCGPGHGISVGSLGGYAEEKDVQGIYVTNCTFIGTTNGVRVKTWPSAPATLTVSDLHFEDLIMDNVSSPIIIDQEYCPHNLCKKDRPSSIKITNVSIKNVRGTTNTAEAVTFICSGLKPCENVEVGDIDLTYNGNQGPITTKCANVKPKFVGKQNPPVCATTAQSA
ncbi:polygalacturonase-like [Sesamum indicum]|uniref:Polygalacturonase-like n=1 Tax=Sesamum indicum TaxID=4182 RepID=A0A6I9U870_SESIN|nr:polygalacturonase-like [Sesamum indicum]